jgi:hypothetical protein
MKAFCSSPHQKLLARALCSRLTMSICLSSTSVPGGLDFDTLMQEHQKNTALVMNSAYGECLPTLFACQYISCTFHNQSKMISIFKVAKFNWRKIWLPLTVQERPSEQHHVVVEGRINTLSLRVYSEHRLCGKVVLPWESNVALLCSSVQNDVRLNSEFVIDGISFKSPIVFGADTDTIKY